MYSQAVHAPTCSDCVSAQQPHSLCCCLQPLNLLLELCQVRRLRPTSTCTCHTLRKQKQRSAMADGSINCLRFPASPSMQDRTQICKAACSIAYGNYHNDTYIFQRKQNIPGVTAHLQQSSVRAPLGQAAAGTDRDQTALPAAAVLHCWPAGYSRSPAIVSSREAQQRRHCRHFVQPVMSGCCCVSC